MHIILPVHDRKEVTRRFIECLKKQTYKDYHLILVDDGSTDSTAEMVRENIPSLTIIRGNGNLWWAGSLQKGIEWLRDNKVADDSVVLLINDDTVFNKDFLEVAVDILNDANGLLLLAQSYSLQDNRLIDAGVHVDWGRLTFDQAKTKDDINCLSTRGLFLFMRDLRKIGSFHPRILPHYASDYEFTIRAHRYGLKLITDSRLKIWEDEKTAGFHSIDKASSLSAAKSIFSKKSTLNPIYWAVFILLSCPPRFLLKNLARVFYRAFRFILLPAFKRSS